MATNAVRDFIPWPEILMLDLMCHLHQMGSMEATPDELYNYIMEPIRMLLHHPLNKTKTVWISVDKRYVPKLKLGTTKKRDARSASAAGAEDGEGEEKERPSNSLPYPPHTQVDEHGRVIFVKLWPTTKSGEFAQYCVAGTPKDNKLVMTRLCASRELRYKVFLYMFTKLAPLETKNLPAGTRLIISFSDDVSYSPVVVESKQDQHRSVWGGMSREFFHNAWPEADHDQPAGLAVLLTEILKTPGAGNGYRPVSVLSCSVDSDMYGIWSMFVSHPRNSVWVNAGLQLYFWNMNPKRDGPNAKVVDMCQFVKGVQKDYGVTGEGLALFMHLLGNDYTNKQALTPRVSAEKAWPRFVAYFAKLEQKTGSVVESPDALARCLMALARNQQNGKEEKAIIAAVKDREELAKQLDRIRAGLRLWRLSFSARGPPEDDEWLKPLKPTQSANKQTDVVMRS